MTRKHHPHPNAPKTAPQRSRAKRHLALPVTIVSALLLCAAGFVGYILWPRWPAGPASLDAPSLPVTVGGTIFNVPPAAVRRNVQRHAGTQERLDLVFLWPSLEPPDPKTQTEPTATSEAIDRVFVTIAVSDAPLSPLERVKTIYPRYLGDAVSPGPAGLAARPFRDASPYESEELLYDPADPEHFFVRCTRNGAKGAIGMCLYDQRFGGADITARFPRDWLENWKAIASGLETLFGSLTKAPRTG